MTFALKLTVIAALVAFTSSAPLDQPPKEPKDVILKQSQDGPNPDGSYSFSYKTSNGLDVQEQGQQVPTNNKDSPAKTSNLVQGSYSYPDESGSLVEVKYTAGEDGFRPAGAHLPVAPTIPGGILRALEWIAAHPEEDNHH